MIAIFKREFKSYFATPIGYIVLAAFYFFLGLYFSLLYQNGSPQLSNALMTMISIVIFTVPILTMRLMSEDRRQKVDQVLLTAPVSLTAVVLGKFLAALAVFGLGFAPSVIFEMIIANHIAVNVFSYLYALLGVILLGGALISIGMFISSTTESPVVSAILTLVINILLMYIVNFKGLITVPTGTNFFTKVWAKIVEIFLVVLEKIDIISISQSFGENVMSIPDIVYFLSVIAIFVFLSIRSLEKRRWS